jgi:ATP-dependent RNA helicase DeaD
MTNFANFNLPAGLVSSLSQMRFTSPTPIQEKAIPLALQGKDILGSAQTGTGKTAAFSIPLITHLLNNAHCTALILTPTRELAMQVDNTIQQMLGSRSVIKTALLIGGKPMFTQFSQLKSRPRIIVGTPGRVNDHLKRETLKLHNTTFLVLDETDRMLDMGFSTQLETIFVHLPLKRQTLMFSATMPANIIKLSGKYMHQPERISVGSTTTPVSKIQQEAIFTSETEKYSHLLTQLQKREGSILVFVKTKYGAERLAQRITRDAHNADAIHGNLKQSKRDRVIRDFRNQKYRIMVATDIAARGLDIPHIEHVINYDLPQCPEDYIHRIGRTARAGTTGSAICFISPADRKKWQAIHKLINSDQLPEKDPKNQAIRKLINSDQLPEKNSKKTKRSSRHGNPKSFKSLKSHKFFHSKRKPKN